MPGLNRGVRLIPVWILLLALATQCFGLCAAAPAGPNIVLVLADDLGLTDLSCYGSTFYETPNIDGLASDGVRFTRAYSACTVCSPTRAALLTGKYPARLHITDWIPGLPPENPKLLVPPWRKYLPAEEITLASILRDRGYVTASIGKWHLGTSNLQQHGFGTNIGGTTNAAPPTYFAPYRIATLPDGPAGEYLTDRLADEACRFMEQNAAKRFFLYLPHFAVHTPIQGKRELVQKYRAKVKPGQNQTNAVYAAMVESLDDALGAIRRKLVDLKLDHDTVIIFTSDNGGRVPTTSNYPLRVGKGSCYEGGTRVPLIVYWPGVTKSNSICDTAVITMDLFPTVLQMAGAIDRAPEVVDGLNLAPLLRRTGDIEREVLFWHYPHYQHYQMGGTTPYAAVRAGDFKLIEFFDDRRVELYDLRNDAGEQRNLAAELPEKAEKMRAQLHAWQKQVGAQMPGRNPNYDPSKPEHDPATRRRPAAKSNG